MDACARLLPFCFRVEKVLNCECCACVFVLVTTADGEERSHHQELRHLAPLRLPLRHAQHVPRVQGPHPDWRRGPDV